MPKTKKESIIFTLIMCLGMVSVMSFYNITLNEGVSAAFTWHAVYSSIPAYFVALVLDLVIVSKVAKVAAFKLPFVKKENQLSVIIGISSCMIFGMVLFMSLYGVLTEVGFTEHFLPIYLTAIARNVVVALPLQLIVMGPIVRKLFSYITVPA